MKTQRSRLERKLQHSIEIGIHRRKVRDLKTIKQYRRYGWGLMGAWVLWVLLICLFQ